MKGYANIPVKVETLDKLRKKKLNRQAKEGRNISWDKFLLDMQGR